MVTSCYSYLFVNETNILYIYCGYCSKDSVQLGEKWKQGVPIEVLPFTYVAVKEKIEKLLGGKAVLRMAKQKAVRFNNTYIYSLCIDYI